jgi:hypothetical protein
MMLRKVQLWNASIENEPACLCFEPRIHLKGGRL